MSFFETTFCLLSTALALYFAHVRFRARMPQFGHAMLASSILSTVFYLSGLDLAGHVCAAAYVWLYMKSFDIIQERGLHDGSLL